MMPLAFDLLSVSDCTRVLEEAESLPERRGLIGGVSRSLSVDATRYDAVERHLDVSGHHRWLRPILRAALARGSEHYGIGALEIVEHPRVLTYGVGGHFAWHVDTLQHIHRRPPFRRLTVSVQLTAADAYDGGALLMSRNGQVETADRTAGVVTMFPSTWRHRVEPVERGVRRALVFWGYSQPPRDRAVAGMPRC